MPDIGSGFFQFLGPAQTAMAAAGKAKPVADLSQQHCFCSLSLSDRTRAQGILATRVDAHDPARAISRKLKAVIFRTRGITPG
ncbi:hypothetical protein [Ruegeria intermedia]|uniref:hypothetical protein n=1 Tax=Ruegeria intermedia TaxID=996115 RepID=UPI00122D47B3|nr:hypothetical protein [Ruegeria intermedia]